MNDHLMRIAFPVKWEVLENFYKDVDGGLEKVERMKKSCEIERDDHVFYEEHELRYASVNFEFLYDRRRKLNAEFIWTEENLDKLIRLDQHIRKLEYELYQKFIGIKENLNSLVAQGFDIFKEYQVTGKIEYDAMYIDDEEHERKKDWVSGLLQDYANWGLLDWFTFGDGDEPDDPRENEDYIFEAWGRWLKYDYFVKNGMTHYLCHLLDTHEWSLYSYSDIVEMDPRCFYLDYEISL